MTSVVRRLLASAFVVATVAGLFAQDQGDALLEYRAGHFDAAIAICRKELAERPDDLDAYSVLGWSLLKLGSYAAAADEATKARAFNRYDPRIIEILAEARFQTGRNEESLRLFQEYAALAPEGGRIDAVYYFLGELFIRSGRFRHADIALTAAVRYQPGDALRWTRLGYARERAGDLRYALAAYDAALALDPQSVDARRGRERSGGGAR